MSQVLNEKTSIKLAETNVTKPGRNVIWALRHFVNLPPRQPIKMGAATISVTTFSVMELSKLSS
jgi:hypothetical protein